MPTVTALPLGRSLHEEAHTEVSADQGAVFAFLDQPANLSGHMTKRSWMMGGGHTTIETDAGLGQRVGSRTRLAGRAFGVRLLVTTEVVERVPPVRKAWETVDAPRLLVIGPYRMWFEVRGAVPRTRVVVGIDYCLPAGQRGLVPERLARVYARWCVARMVSDVANRFPG